MNTDFVEYLKNYSSKKVGRNSLFVPDANVLGDDDITNAEKMLNCSLPAGYEVFLQTLGTGCWADASVIAPEELHAFDESVGEMCGLIAIAENVDGQGSYVAFNPLDNKLYFCCHDPFGYALIANSFGEFIELITALWMNDPEKGARNYYLSLPSFKEVELPQDEPNRA